MSGFAATSDPDLAERIRIVQTTAGGIPSPLDCYLVLRGVMTLPLRMDRHCANALEIAQFLDSHSAVAKVNYPGLLSHPGHELAARQMSDAEYHSLFCYRWLDAVIPCCIAHFPFSENRPTAVVGYLQAIVRTG